jgi:hypothetical protein
VDSWARCAASTSNKTSGTTRFAVASTPPKKIDVESSAISALAISATRRSKSRRPTATTSAQLSAPSRAFATIAVSMPDPKTA